MCSYSSNWPSGCYQGIGVGGYASYQNCVPPKPNYTTVVNAQGQVCVVMDCSDRLLLQSLTVDTQCNPSTYDQFCSLNNPSTVVDNNPLLPNGLFINLIANKTVDYTINPGPPPPFIEIMFLLVLPSPSARCPSHLGLTHACDQDMNNLTSARVAKTYWKDYLVLALNSLPATLNVGFGYAWHDGTLRGGQGIFYDRSLVDYWTDPTCNVLPPAGSTGTRLSRLPHLSLIHI